MRKNFEFFKSSLFLPIAVLVILYAYWLLFIPAEAFFGNWNLKLGALCLSVYLAVTILGKLFVNSQHLYFLPFVAVIPISLIAVYFGFLYFAFMFMFDFYRERPVFIFLLGFVIVTFAVLRKLAAQDQRQVSFFITTFPILALLIFNFVIFCPKVWEAENFEDHKYYVVEEIGDYPHRDTSFYKCKISSFQCEILGSTQFANPEILIDERKKEVSLIDARGLVYTDGSNPRKYTLPSAQLDDHLYYLSEKCNGFNYNRYNECETYTYIPYQGDTNNRSCEPLPIKVVGDFDYTLYWSVDDVSKEISLLYADDGILVFTYGESPRCFLDECEIMSQ